MFPITDEQREQIGIFARTAFFDSNVKLEPWNDLTKSRKDQWINAGMAGIELYVEWPHLDTPEAEAVKQMMKSLLDTTCDYSVRIREAMKHAETYLSNKKDLSYVME